MTMLSICLSWMWSRSQQHWAIQRCSFTSPEDRSDATSSSSSKDDRTLRVGKETWMIEPSVYDSYCTASYCMNYSINSCLNFKECKAVIKVLVMLCIIVFTINISGQLDLAGDECKCQQTSEGLQASPHQERWGWLLRTRIILITRGGGHGNAPVNDYRQC